MNWFLNSEDGLSDQIISSGTSLSGRIWLRYRDSMKMPVENISLPLYSVPKINVFVSQLCYTAHANRLTLSQVHSSPIVSFYNSH